MVSFKNLIFYILILFSLACNKSKNSGNEQKKAETCDTIVFNSTLGVEKKLKLLCKAKETKDYFSLDSSGISIFASKADKKIGKVECKLYFDEFELFTQFCRSLSKERIKELYENKGTNRFNTKKFTSYIKTPDYVILKSDSSLKLKGLRIAIDPGHVAGSYKEALVEARFVSVAQNDSPPIRFYESELTFATASFLEQMLRNEGAEVFLTRKAHGTTAYGKTFKQWLNQDFRAEVRKSVREMKISTTKALFLLNKATEQQIFHEYFKIKELYKRAEIINEFNPHITVVIHYNADVQNERRYDKFGNVKAANLNYNMAFVPGSFIEGELENQNARIEFLRLLATNDIGSSIDFSEKVLESFTQMLNVETVSPTEKLPYLDKASIATHCKGVYARNLLLARKVNGIVCYGETFCQDNALECVLLSKKDVEINGLKTSSRVKQVAEAYFQGIMNYVNSKKKKTAKSDLLVNK